METILTKHLSRYFKAQYDKEIETLEIQPTKAQLEGDLTVVEFPLHIIAPKKPEELAAE